MLHSEANQADFLTRIEALDEDDEDDFIVEKGEGVGYQGKARDRLTRLHEEFERKAERKQRDADIEAFDADLDGKRPASSPLARPPTKK